MVGRDLRSRLHLLRPDLRGTVLKVATRQAMTRSAATEHIFYPGEKVLVRDYRLGQVGWQSAVVEKVGTKTYVVLSVHEERWRRHSDQIKPYPCGIQTSEVEDNEQDGAAAMTPTAEGEETVGNKRDSMVTREPTTSQLPRPGDQGEGPYLVPGTRVAPSLMEGGETNPPPHQTGSEL